MIPDWLQPTFLLLPALIWMCFGVGIPWALALLPRADWSRRIEVFALAIALGPAFTTTGMFVLGTFGHWSIASILLISALIAALGLTLALRQRPVDRRASPPLYEAERGSGGEVPLALRQHPVDRRASPPLYELERGSGGEVPLALRQHPVDRRASPPLYEVERGSGG